MVGVSARTTALTALRAHPAVERPHRRPRRPLLEPVHRTVQPAGVATLRGWPAVAAVRRFL